MPAPAATPLTAATTGFSRSRMATISGLYSAVSTAAEVPLAAAAAQVGARAEPAARAGQHHCPDGVVARAAFSAASSSRRRLAVERVERLGPVEGERRHAAVGVDEELRRRGRVEASAPIVGARPLGASMCPAVPAQSPVICLLTGDARSGRIGPQFEGPQEVDRWTD